MEISFNRNQGQDEDEEDELLAENRAPADSSGAFAKLPAKERTEIDRDLGLAFEKTNALDQALVYLRRAYRTESDPAIKPQINKQVQQLRATLRRRATNLARQPMIHTELEQDRAVHPKIPEPATPSPPKPRAAAAGSPTRAVFARWGGAGSPTRAVFARWGGAKGATA